MGVIRSGPPGRRPAAPATCGSSDLVILTPRGPAAWASPGPVVEPGRLSSGSRSGVSLCLSMGLQCLSFKGRWSQSAGPRAAATQLCRSCGNGLPVRRSRARRGRARTPCQRVVQTPRRRSRVRGARHGAVSALLGEELGDEAGRSLAAGRGVLANPSFHTDQGPPGRRGRAAGPPWDGRRSHVPGVSSGRGGRRGAAGGTQERGAPGLVVE